ncbi:hypothetical protein CALCODRAFT_504870 [Calocera cornea HHB12733]|uniref:Uncharacterized protein n=1 Tax=Calocera cornea HHB12733 TaxID=1353952 RepID=A0A165C6A9_9BASI|nr:hypothetical protein CALCODRAFT_504870 [Calocera cornea HHB12733]
MTFENSNRLLECLVSVTKVSTFPAASDIHQDFRVAMPLIVNRLKTPHRHDFMIPYPTMCAWTVLHWCLEAGSFSAHENQVEHLDQARSTPTDGMAAIVEDVSCDAVDLIKGGALQRLSPLLLLYMRPFCPASITIPWEAFRTARLQRDSLSDLISSTDWKYWMWVMGVRGIPYIMGLQHAVDALKWRSRLEEVVSFLLQEIPWDVEASGILEEYYKATGIRVQAIPSNVEEKEADRRAEETP